MSELKVASLFEFEKVLQGRSNKLFYSKSEADAIFAEKDKEIRKLYIALWLARAELCRRLDVDRYLRKHRNSRYNEEYLTWNEACVAMEVKMCRAESKCRSKAEEYK